MSYHVFKFPKLTHNLPGCIHLLGLIRGHSPRKFLSKLGFFPFYFYSLCFQWCVISRFCPMTLQLNAVLSASHLFLGPFLRIKIFLFFSHGVYALTFLVYPGTVSISFRLFSNPCLLLITTNSVTLFQKIYFLLFICFNLKFVACP